MYKINTRDKVRVLKLGETVWLDGKIVQVANVPCFKCCFFKLGFGKSLCTMSFPCNELVGINNLYRFAFIEIKGGV